MDVFIFLSMRSLIVTRSTSSPSVGDRCSVEGARAALERAIGHSTVIEELGIEHSGIIIPAAPEEVVEVFGGLERRGVGGRALAL